MPELPEVETTVRGIRASLLDRRIERAWVDWPRALNLDSITFCDRIAGQQIRNIQRRAKYIVIRLEADYLLIHLKMTGRLYVVTQDTVHEADRWVHFRFDLDDGMQLRFSDSRKFGRVLLVTELEQILGHLGPEPLDEEFTEDQFLTNLRQRHATIKPLLLNQEFIAGVGNIYADEALHLAHIHPTRGSSSLTEPEVTLLYHSLRQVLQQGIDRQGASVNWYRNPDGQKGAMQDELLVYGRESEVCKTCGIAIIQKITLHQRGTHFCPACQR